MFGRGILKSSKHVAPAWVRDLMANYCPNTQYVWFPSSSRCYGCASPALDRIELHTPEAKSDKALVTVLHEIGHILCPRKSTTPYYRGVSWHGIDFIRTVAGLYADHGVYDAAINGGDGYKTIQRWLKEHRSEFVKKVPGHCPDHGKVEPEGKLDARGIIDVCPHCLVEV